MTQKIEPFEPSPAPNRKAGDDIAPKQKKTNLTVFAGIAVMVVLICGLGGTVYFLKEKMRATHNIETKLAQLESRIQTLQNSQSATASAQSVESLRRDLQNFKEQTIEQFIKEERSFQDLIKTRLAPPQPNAVEPAPITNQTTELQTPPEPINPVEIKREPPPSPQRSKETQGFLDFIETLAKNFFAIAKEVFQRIGDLVSADKRPSA